jgi:hypothetical protein
VYWPFVPLIGGLLVMAGCLVTRTRRRHFQVLLVGYFIHVGGVVMASELNWVLREVFERLGVDRVRSGQRVWSNPNANYWDYHLCWLGHAFGLDNDCYTSETASARIHQVLSTHQECIINQWYYGKSRKAADEWLAEQDAIAQVIAAPEVLCSR